MNNSVHEGYIPLFRRFLKNDLWIEKRKFSKAEAWIDLLFMARYGEEPEELFDRGELIIVKYGDILTSVKLLSKKWKRSETWVRALLEHLKSKSRIKKHTKKNRRTIIHVVKLDYFQNIVGKRSTERSTEEAQKKHRRSHKNKDNKDNKDNIYTKVYRSKTYGNPIVNFILEEFKKTYGFVPTDKYPRQVAWNLAQRFIGFLKKHNRRQGEEAVKKAISYYFKWLSKKDWAERVQTMDTLRRKTNILFAEIERKKYVAKNKC